MRTRSRPSRWRLVRAVGPALILLAALLTPVAVVLSSAHAKLSDEDAFVETFSPMVDDPKVQAHVVAMAIAEIDIPALVETATKELEAVGVPRPDLPPLKIPKWLSDSAEYLEGLGAPSWLTDPLTPTPGDPTATIDSLTDLAAETIEAGIDSALTSLVRTDRFSIAWQETLRASHIQVVEQLLAAPAGTALRVDIQPIIIATRDALVEDGAAFARYIPDLEDWGYSAVLLPSQQMEAVAPFASWVLRFGSSIVWIPVILFAAGVAITRSRPAWILVGGLFTVISAIVTREIVASGSLQDAIHSRLDPLSAAATSALLDAALPPAASTLVAVAILGSVFVTIGGLLMLLPRRGVSHSSRR